MRTNLTIVLEKNEDASQWARSCSGALGWELLLPGVEKVLMNGVTVKLAVVGRLEVVALEAGVWSGRLCDVVLDSRIGETATEAGDCEKMGDWRLAVHQQDPMVHRPNDGPWSGRTGTF